MKRPCLLLLALLALALPPHRAGAGEPAHAPETGTQPPRGAQEKPSAEEQRLKKQATRRNPEGYKELARYYIGAYRFEEAREALESYKKYAKQPSCEREEEAARTGRQMMMGVVDVVVVDSVVVDKGAFLEAYHLDADAGKLCRTDDFFAAMADGPQPGTSGTGGTAGRQQEATPAVRPVAFTPAAAASAPDTTGSDSSAQAAEPYVGTLFRTGLGKNILYGKEGKIYARTSRLGEWSRAQELSAEVNDSTSNYPFLCADGQTLYFASTGHNSLGGYDIFITRFDSESNDFLRPDNVGMPFNSPYNDYMMAIDEVSGLGWFASDRYQPQGKVCVYVFLPDESRKIYDIETTDEAALRSLARLASIRSTWPGHEKERDKALAALQRIKTQGRERTRKEQADFLLVIDDERTYTSYLDFHSDAAAKKAEEWQENCAKLAALKQSLGKSRDLYEASPESQKRKISLNILDQEKQVRALESTVARQENETRTIEIQALQ